MRKFAIKKMMLILGVMLVVTVVLTPLPVFPGDRDPGSGEEIKSTAGNQQGDIQVPPPPFSEDIFPCSQCHAEQETNLQRRELEMHEDIVLNHAEKSRWCLDCHDARNRDMLHLADGELVDFKESYWLCGQCHGPKLRDWRAGIHGRRTGSWNGQKRYLLCAHCHDPHSPRFKKLKPEPPPVKPGRIRK
ncbi:MAG: hypothetical protein JSV88_23425 [Candidatus Aminicenantes bacterium]|nr:MAG: hypothetical protein JSV88_23425 [Candidatus Aminicenantes bacterium]